MPPPLFGHNVVPLFERLYLTRLEMVVAPDRHCFRLSFRINCFTPCRYCTSKGVVAYVCSPLSVAPEVADMLSRLKVLKPLLLTPPPRDSSVHPLPDAVVTPS